MKKRIKEKALFEQLYKIPNITIACEKTGLSRNTVYRWCKEDSDFKIRLDEALQSGVESISDLAESKIISRINSGDIRASIYWLDNRKKEYRKPREKTPLLDSMIDDDQIGSITITMLDQQGKEVDLKKKPTSDQP